METSTLYSLFESGPLSTSDLVAFRVQRRLGAPAQAEIDLRSLDPIEPDDLLGCAARLSFGREGPEHVLDGVVRSVTLIASPEDDLPRGHLHRLVVCSQMGLLAHEVDCRIFQNKDVQEIVSELLVDLGLPAARQSWSLVGKYPKREVCVQYRESALAFVSRLLEEEGIFFSSESGEQGDTVVFEDDSTVSRPIDGEKTLHFRPPTGLLAMDDSIASITRRHRTASGKVVLRDYDFKKPDLDMTVSKAADVDADLELYDYPGLYVEPKEGARLAEVRLQSLQAERTTLELESACLRWTPGRWFEVAETPYGDDGEYLLTSTTHELAMGVLTARATAVPRAIPFRTPQRTPRPVIHGPQTAEVMAPKGSPAEEIHTDEHGRCKVRFHWDRRANPDDTASCWLRVAQLQTGGSMILPRVGWEVIVEFAEGNPDRPLVTGRLFNGRNMPPYALPEGKSRTALQTASSPGGAGRNEIRLEDKAGSEEVKVQSQKNTTLATGNDKTKSTAVNETKNVGVNAELTVGANQTVKITNGYQNSVKGAQSLSVGGNRTVEVNAVYGMTAGGASSTSVGGNHFEMDGNPIKALLALAVKVAKEAVEKEVERALNALDKAVSDKVEQVMGPIEDLQDKAAAVGTAMEAVSNGDLSGAADALGSAGMLPSVDDMGAKLGGQPAGGDDDDGGGGGSGKASKNKGGDAGGAGDGGDDGGGAGKASKNKKAVSAGGDDGGNDDGGGSATASKNTGKKAASSGGGDGVIDDGGAGGGSATASKNKKGSSGADAGGGNADDSGGNGKATKNKKGGPLGSDESAADAVLGGGSVSSALGLDDFIGGALDKGADELGDILGLGGTGGGGSSDANKGGPDGGVGGNSGADSATGPGYSVNVCSATHSESVGAVKATIAAGGIHTMVTGARTQSIGAAHIELVGGTRAETCLSCKTEQAAGLVVISAGPETEAVAGDRSSMVGGAILEKIGDTCVIQAGGKVVLAGAFHKVDGADAIVFKCGSSEVVIDGAGITIKASAVSITAPTIVLTQAVSEA